MIGSSSWLHVVPFAFGIRRVTCAWKMLAQ